MLIIGIDASASAVTSEQAQRIANILEPKVMVVTSPFVAFHWEKRNDFNGLNNQSAALDDSWTCSLVRKEMEAAYESNFKYGYYVAVDPVTTRSYGGPGGEHSWLLIQTKMPNGLRYLDLYTQRTDTVMQAVSQEVRDISCTGMFPYGAQPNTRCSELAQAVLKLLNVDAIKYRYGNVYLDKYCSGRDYSAFIILKAAPSDLGLFHAFTYETIGDQAEREIIQGIFSATARFPGDVVEQLWMDIRPNQVTSESIVGWMHRNLLNCQL